MAGSCVRLVVYIERMKAMSSTCRARCGSASETHMPHLPCWANLNGLRISAPALCGILDLAGDLVEVRACRGACRAPAWGRTGPSGSGRRS